MAVAALNSGKRSPGTVIHDGGTYQFGTHTFRSHGDHGLGAVDMTRSIVKSSNVYYYSLANEMGVDLIHQQLTPFGFGVRTEIDLEGEVTGVLPSTDWKMCIRDRLHAAGLAAGQGLRQRGHTPGVQGRAHSITLGTRKRPSSTEGALCWLAARSSVSVTRSSRRRSATACTADSGVYNGSTPRVSTAPICSTMPKKPLSWASICACSAAESSSRASWAMRLTSWGVSAIE